ncbi:hypothetical protein NEOLEDRAFT_1134272 [Neolentinus lepideus HHB14362 ss-1]|uniref:Uncharacterized protein n=1 Tax=Neolentinus lepideus HHB14362 ss-1 TaxID=1314782 RepID=A0A165SES2_9AGAM|nr:hypothetical protein NEOLEDRAFT_1134272 [Neolentinus lepideus HHB14362 ss-1]
MPVSKDHQDNMGNGTLIGWLSMSEAIYHSIVISVGTIIAMLRICLDGLHLSL